MFNFQLGCGCTVPLTKNENKEMGIISALLDRLFADGLSWTKAFRDIRAKGQRIVNKGIARSHQAQDASVCSVLKRYYN